MWMTLGIIAGGLLFVLGLVLGAAIAQPDEPEYAEASELDRLAIVVHDEREARSYTLLDSSLAAMRERLSLAPFDCRVWIGRPPARPDLTLELQYKRAAGAPE